MRGAVIFLFLLVVSCKKEAPDLPGEVPLVGDYSYVDSRGSWAGGPPIGRGPCQNPPWGGMAFLGYHGGYFLDGLEYNVCRKISIDVTSGYTFTFNDPSVEGSGSLDGDTLLHIDYSYSDSSGDVFSGWIEYSK